MNVSGIDIAAGASAGKIREQAGQINGGRVGKRLNGGAENLSLRVAGVIQVQIHILTGT